jgi:choline dehydrogenase
LKPILKRPNLHLATGAHVERILFEGRRATGLRYSENGQSREARARGEVILAAGTIGSPQLLELSRVGAPDGLAAIGVSAVQALESARTCRTICSSGRSLALNARARSMSTPNPCSSGR